MGWTPDLIPDQTGRAAVVTGANGGLGLATAHQLARRGARVVMAARDQAKAEAGRLRIERDVPDADLEVVPLDLASLDSVRACADAVIAGHDGLDLVINNAGVMAIPRHTTAEGFEMQLGVNHLGHFALTLRLLPLLRVTPGARVVTVTSFARYPGRALDPADVHMQHGYSPWRAYNRSKLANVHFALELQRRLTATGLDIASLAADPGFSHTDLQARSVRASGGGWSQRFWYTMVRIGGVPPNRGHGRCYAPRPIRAFAGASSTGPAGSSPGRLFVAACRGGNAISLALGHCGTSPLGPQARMGLYASLDPEQTVPSTHRYNALGCRH